MPKYMKRL